jgi:peptidoglycan-associated lipoprotein
MLALLSLTLIAGFGCQQQQQVHKPKSVAGLNRINFDTDRSDIKSEAKTTLENNAAWLKANKDAKINVEGHCDERGTEEYNLALGHRRANAAKSYLVNLGVSAGRLSTKSFGEEKPLETCHNESCWWKNRRAEFAK